MQTRQIPDLKKTPIEFFLVLPDFQERVNHVILVSLNKLAIIISRLTRFLTLKFYF